MTGTVSFYEDKVAAKLLKNMPQKIGSLRPSHTFTYEMDSEDFEIFEEHPKEISQIYSNAAIQACQMYWAYFKATREVKPEEIGDTQKIEQMVTKDNMSGRNDGLKAFNRLKTKLIFYKTHELRDIGPHIEKEPIVIEGRIMAVSEKNGYIKEAWVKCPNGCDSDDMVAAGPTLRTYIPKCKVCKSKMHIQSHTAITDYIQTIKLQDFRETGLTQNPITFDVKVVGDDVFNTWIGKKVRIAGNFLTDIDSTKHIHKQFIFCKYMHEVAEVDNVCMTKERAEEIRQALEFEVGWTSLVKSFAPQIEGRIPIKESMLYAFVGGSDETRRTDINILEIGNAGQGKSETIKQIPRVIAKSMYFLGNTATAAGLGIGMVKLDNTTSVPQGGPLVLCNPHGVVAIDELDKMHQEDRKSLLSSMEQQVVTKVVSGTRLSLPSKVSIIAAANPKFGEWDKGHGIPENINFPAFLLTRFDVVWCTVDSNDIKKQSIAAKILNLDPITEEQAIEPLLTEQELMQYINYCKRLNPKLTREAKKLLNDFYLRMAQLTEGEDKVVPMTPRELEGMIRLATARAKLLQKTEATVDDVNAIMELKTKALTSFPGVTTKGAGVQLNLLDEATKEEKTKEDIIFECMDEEGIVNQEEVVKKWVEAGIYTEKKAEREFQSMIGGRFWMRKHGYIYK